MEKQKRISPEQETATKSVLGHFANAFRWVILLAQMQSGKSDAYMFVAFELLRTKKVKKVVILAGFQDKELVEQLKNYTPAMKMYRRYMEEDLHLSIDEREEIEDMIPTSIEVVCGTKLSQPQFQEASDTLFIWDESHYAQSKINRPFKFIRSLDISADGASDKLEGDRNNYFLSVSATPYSEISDLIHEEQRKKVVKMKPGKGYVSVGKFFRAKKIIPFKSWEITLPTCFQDQKKIAVPKYSIVRIREDKEMEKAVQIAQAAGMDYEIYDAEQKKQTLRHNDKTKMQSLGDLESAPLRHKVIFIRGMLRMGKRIPKTHIAFVMETSKDPNTDVLLQGLLGRMCGYHTNEDIKIFVSENVLKKKGGVSEIERYIQLMEDESQEIKVMPKKGCNLVGGKQNAQNEWFEAIPIIIPLAEVANEDRADPDYELYAKELIIERVKQAMDDGSAINHNTADKTDELLAQTHHTLLENWNVRKIAKPGGTINDTYKDMPRLISEAIAHDKGISVIPPGCGLVPNEMNIWVFNTEAYAALGFPKGTVVLHGRTKAASADEIQKRAIPKTTKMEAFTIQHEDGEIIVGNGAYAIHAPIDTWHNPAKMQEYVENMVRLSRIQLEGGQAMPRCITSNQVEGSNWKGIIVTEEVLQALEKNGVIYNYILRNYGDKLKVNRTSGKTPEHLKEAGQLRLAKIQW
jgi:hypothetical protein